MSKRLEKNRSARRYSPVTRFATITLLSLIALPLTLIGMGCDQAPPPGRVAHDSGAAKSNLTADLTYLASDDLGGRGLGSSGLDQALEFVANRFQSLGLEPPATGSSAKSGLYAYYQPFSAHGKTETANIIAILPGDPALSPKAVVIGAHIDHLGTDSSLSGDTIYNGAEDNASGVSAVLAIAEQLVDWRATLDDLTGLRSVVFIAFSAEESGLLGSHYYAANPVIPHRETIAMINLDSVGRLRDDQLYIFGTGTAREFPAIIEGLNQTRSFNLTTQAHGVGGSDHVSFIHKQVPALHLFTGPHTDYHKVTDEVGSVNIDGVAEVAEFTFELVRYLSYRSRPLTFVAAEQKSPPPAMGGQRRASTGFMPDFSRESGGVKVGRVTPGAAADKAGLKEGDIIVALDGESADTLADYSALLRAHAPGDEVVLSVLRGADKMDLSIVLQAR
jgi:Peptidase family M28/PDZ domain